MAKFKREQGTYEITFIYLPMKITFMHFGGKVFDFKYINSSGLL